MFDSAAAPREEVEVAEARLGGLSGFVGRHAASLVFFGQQVEVQAELLADLVVDLGRRATVAGPHPWRQVRQEIGGEMTHGGQPPAG
ncbi:MAG: hypothetical protein AAF596_01860 [Planctomycetota bacterium]